MNNEDPDTSGHACSDTFNEDVFSTFSWADNCQSVYAIENCFDDVILNLDGAVASCAAQPNILADLPLESDDIGLQSLPSNLTFNQQQCAETGLLGVVCNSAAQDNVFGDTPYLQQSSCFSNFDNNNLDCLDSNSVSNQYAVTHISPSSIPSPRIRPDTAQILEMAVLKHRALPKNAHAEPQRTSYRCGSRIAQAQFPFEQTTCGQTFVRSKDLKRHKSTVHREDGDPVYLCRCGKDDPRKDNHSRHVGVCVKSPCPRPYVCKCSHASQGRDDHLEHVKTCSPSKRSRRRPNAS